MNQRIKIGKLQDFYWKDDLYEVAIY